MESKNFNEEFVSSRIKKFQELMRENEIDATLIRTFSSFVYFTGVKWLRPALIIPSEGEPVAFVFEHEKEEFKEVSSIKNVRTYSKVEELMREVRGTVKEMNVKRMGFDYSVERDSYVLFFEMFKKLNPEVEVVDVHSLIYKLRMVKDPSEIYNIREASKLAMRGMKVAAETVSVGRTELEIASEIVYDLMNSGSESPKVYVNVGLRPRIHSEPRKDVKVKTGDCVNVTIAAEYNGYYSNMSRTFFIQEVSNLQRDAWKALLDAYNFVISTVKAGKKISEVEKEIEKIVSRKGFQKNYVIGFTHSVGLMIEEDPITTIVVPHRSETFLENMTIAALHAPLAIPGAGLLKYEDTFIVSSDGLRNLTDLRVDHII
ncbi:MAG: M24 family metallopeptidase [Candidatus Asgardarchaeia archaeon]